MGDTSQTFAAMARAYEGGRLGWALPRAAAAAAVAVPAVLLGATLHGAALMAVLLVLIAVVGGWRSRGGLLGALTGTAIAAVPLVVGGLVGDACACAGGVCLSLCGIGCAMTAAMVGVVGGTTLARLRHGRLDFLTAAAAAIVVGSVVCPVAGVGSLFGAVVGAAIAAPPAAVLTGLLFRKALA